MDRLVGRGHLFKRSIILVKAWCYYESRILGAHRGLFSSYALETLVLYIFNVFHKRLHRPLDVRSRIARRIAWILPTRNASLMAERPSFPASLQVLLLFLEIFSQFDWEKYAVSIKGPVSSRTTATAVCLCCGGKP